MIMLTRNDGSGVVVNGDNMEPPVALTVTGQTIRIILLLFLACAAALAASSSWFSRYAAPTQVISRQEPIGRSAGAVVWWDRTEPLRKGERVVISSLTGRPVEVQAVAAAPNEAVVLRRGSNIEGLVMLGAGKYYVTAADGAGSIVNADQIRGIYRPEPRAGM